MDDPEDPITLEQRLSNLEQATQKAMAAADNTTLGLAFLIQSLASRDPDLDVRQDLLDHIDQTLDATPLYSREQMGMRRLRFVINRHGRAAD